MNLSSEEEALLAQSYDIKLTKRRQLMVLGVGSAAAIAAIYLSTSIESRWLLGSAMALYVVVTAAEKWAFGNGVLLYKSLIRKLDARVKELEVDA